MFETRFTPAEAPVIEKSSVAWKNISDFRFVLLLLVQMVCCEFPCAVQIGSSQKSITSEAEQVFAIDRTIVFREVSAEETRLEELHRIKEKHRKDIELLKEHFCKTTRCSAGKLVF